MKYLIVVLASLLVVFLAFSAGMYYKTNQVERAYQVCSASHISYSGELEEACGDALDATSTEFVCNQTGKYCWLELM